MTVHRFPLRFPPFVLPGQKPETKEGAVIDLRERRSIVVGRVLGPKLVNPWGRFVCPWR